MRQLLDAGAEVFATKGYHATRVDDIVKLAETSHGTFYLYFANKEELFRALAAEVADEMQALAEALGPAARRRRPAEPRCSAWIEQFAELYERYGPVIRAWTEAEIGGSEFGRLGTDVLTQFTARARGAHRRGRAARPRPDDRGARARRDARAPQLLRARRPGAASSATTIVDTLARVDPRALFGAP